MGKIHINGLFRGVYMNQDKQYNGMEIIVFDGEGEDGSFGNLIFRGKSDKNGELTGDICDKYVGEEVILSIVEPGFKIIQDKIKVTSIGLFYTVRLDYDLAYHSNSSNHVDNVNWNSSVEYTNASRAMEIYIREYRFSNTVIRWIHYIILIISIFLGVLFILPWSLIVSIVSTLILEFFGPYTIGLKPFFIRRAK